MNNWTIQAMADVSHPNRRQFRGVLTTVDIPSDKSPSGARGHNVILTYTAALAALPSLVGMCLDYKDGWDGHDARNKVGVITDAVINGKQIIVSGYLFARDFPEVVKKADKDNNSLGLSYELANAHVEDMRANIWKLTRATFTGAAILLRDKAAYRNTRFILITPGKDEVAA